MFATERSMPTRLGSIGPFCSLFQSFDSEHHRAETYILDFSSELSRKI